MKNQPRARRLVLSLAAFGVGVIIVALIVFRSVLVEQWSILRLRFGALESRDAVARRLGELRSLRAIPHLVRAAKEEGDRGRVIGCRFTSGLKRSYAEYRTDSVLFDVLAKLGEPAREAIRKELGAPAPAKVQPDSAMLVSEPPMQPASLAKLLEILDSGMPLEYASDPVNGIRAWAETRLLLLRN